MEIVSGTESSEKTLPAIITFIDFKKAYYSAIFTWKHGDNSSGIWCSPNTQYPEITSDVDDMYTQTPGQMPDDVQYMMILKD